MLKLLKQPFPIPENATRKWEICIGISVFVSLFLFLFKPFGLAEVSQAWVFAGYGLVCFLVLVFNMFIVPKIFPQFFIEARWTGFSEIFFTLYNICTVGLGNVLFSSWLGFMPLQLSSILNFQLITLLVGILPVAALILLKQNRLLKKNLANAKTITAHLHPSEIETAAVLYISSADNYIEIHFLEDGAEKKKLLRGTLKKTEEILSAYQQFFRCHRMHIVNLEKIVKVGGNAQGYKIHLQNAAAAIPVSRSLNKIFMERLQMASQFAPV
jgi:hypothetical protein